MPARIALLLHAVRVLLGYGRHLSDTARQRAAAPSFTSVGVCFGTDRLSAILARVQRGILRAMALERVLLERAAAGRDIDIVQRRASPPAPPAEPDESPADTQAAPPADAQPAEVPPARKPARRPSRPAFWNDPELFLPTLEDFVAEVRRRPIGRTIVDICLDLGVVPAVCTGPFWDELFDIMQFFGGSLATLMRERWAREIAFEKEQDRRPPGNWQWWDMKEATIRRALGFMIGEDPVNPFDAPLVPAAPVATGPP